ncbi:hypothetical protein, partial [Comamonas resistens]|uniref:hypothetical protein n=1 Tax=Comamonas resistens TaxID=3046670 RepID=UPI0039BD2489
LCFMAVRLPSPADSYQTSGEVLQDFLSADTVTLLRQWGHKVELKPAMGRTQTIEIRDGMLLGASDPRNPDGKTMGY